MNHWGAWIYLPIFGKRNACKYLTCLSHSITADLPPTDVDLYAKGVAPPRPSITRTKRLDLANPSGTCLLPLPMETRNPRPQTQKPHPKDPPTHSQSLIPKTIEFAQRVLISSGFGKD